MSGPGLVTAAVQTAAVVLGALYGRAVHYPGRPPTVFTALAAVAVLLMVAGLLVTLTDRRPGNLGRPAAVSGACLLYALGSVLLEPFLLVHGLPAVAGAAVVLVPFLLALSALVRCRAWVSAAGVTVFVFAGAAMLAGNAGVSDAGSGFLSHWTS